MKILWFTNTACSATERLGIKGHRGGWLKSLEEEISVLQDIELNICFYATKDFAPFILNRTTYYPVERKNTGSKAGRYINRIFSRKNNDEHEIQLLLSVINLVKPDLIHIHGTEENFGLVQKLVSIPVVISIQGILTPYNEKYYAGIPRVTASRYEGISQKLSLMSAAYLQNKLEKKANREKRVLETSRYIIGRTDWDKRVTRIMSPQSVYFYNNEILRSSFYTAVWNKSGFNSKLRIVTISSGAIFKGFETIVNTAKILASYPAFSFEWMVVGLDEKTAFVKTVQRWLKADFNKLNIVLLGSKNEQEIVALLQTSDIYCQVSHIENSPNSLCEAMLMGMPVIASNVGGTSSLLENSSEGLLLQDGDSYAFAGAIAEMSSDFARAAQFGSNARKKALCRHNRKKITEDLSRVYAEIIKRKNVTTLSAHG